MPTDEPAQDQPAALDQQQMAPAPDAQTPDSARKRQSSLCLPPPAHRSPQPRPRPSAAPASPVTRARPAAARSSPASPVSSAASAPPAPIQTPTLQTAHQVRAHTPSPPPLTPPTVAPAGTPAVSAAAAAAAAAAVQFAPPPVYATLGAAPLATQQFYDYNGAFTGASSSTFRPNKRPRNLTEEEAAAITRNFSRGDFFVGSSAPVRIDPRLPVRLTLGEGDHVHFTVGEALV